ncbi:MAG TPA: glycine cleavage system protein H [Trebonia sp.]|nr:glycine cleavage system protein H [Trebonia sp.]
MTDIPEGLRYTYDHLWACQEPDGTVKVGVTQRAAMGLGDVTYVDMPETGRVLPAGTQAVTVDTVMGTSDFITPISGRVSEVNAGPAQDPQSIRRDPYGAWLFRLEPDDLADLGKLLDASGYRSMTGDQ